MTRSSRRLKAVDGTLGGIWLFGGIVIGVLFDRSGVIGNLPAWAFWLVLIGWMWFGALILWVYRRLRKRATDASSDVIYELQTWTESDRLTLRDELENKGIPSMWRGGELRVGRRYEAKVDGILSSYGISR
jgi:hypothetical protein